MERRRAGVERVAVLVAAVEVGLPGLEEQALLGRDPVHVPERRLHLGLATGYALLYSAMALFGAMLVFEYRNLK